MNHKHHNLLSGCYAIVVFGSAVVFFVIGSLPDYQASFGAEDAWLGGKPLLIGMGDLWVPLFAFGVLAAAISRLPSSKIRTFLGCVVVLAGIFEMAWMLWLRHLLIHA